MRRLAVLLVLVAACSAGERDASKQPAPAPAVAPAVLTPPATTLPPAEPASSVVGWWRGDHVCLELFANGDFELAVPGADPKVMVIGRAAVAPAGAGAFALQLTVARIWRARFTSPCARVHELGDWSRSESALGLTFKPGETLPLTLTRKGDAAAELCGQTCEPLTRATPLLSGRWRVADLRLNDPRDVPRKTGELLEIVLRDQAAHVWTALDPAKHGQAYGAAQVRFVAADRFAVSFTAERHADVPDGATPTVFGAPLTPGANLELSARRLPEERLEVCGADGRCSTLERWFDGYDHELR